MWAEEEALGPALSRVLWLLATASPVPAKGVAGPLDLPRVGLSEPNAAGAAHTNAEISGRALAVLQGLLPGLSSGSTGVLNCAWSGAPLQPGDLRKALGQPCALGEEGCGGGA